jgi:hypothetical protein
MPVICPTTEAEYFCAEGWMTQISLRLLAKFDFWRSFYQALSQRGSVSPTAAASAG